MTVVNDYLYATNSEEADRLRLLARVADPDTLRYVARIGVGTGWRCLEVGAGAGTIARALADRVGPEGHVVAVDLDTRHLAGGAAPNLEVRQADVLVDDLESGSYDFVHARHLLAHLGSRAGLAIARLVAALQPGGVLLVEDVDLSRLTTATGDPAVQAASDRLLAATVGAMAERGIDPVIGLRLAPMLEDAGLVDVEVDARFRYERGGDDSVALSIMTLGALRPMVDPSGLGDDVEVVLAALARPDYRGFTPLQVAAWGRRPGGAVARPNTTAGIITVRPAEAVDTLQRLPHFVGISAQTAGSREIGMNIVVLPPGAAADAHFHDGFETAIFVLEGDVVTRYGDGLAQTVHNTPGDFLFIPAGVPHQPRNPSATVTARALVARNTADEQESVVPYPAAES